VPAVNKLISSKTKKIANPGTPALPGKMRLTLDEIRNKSRKSETGFEFYPIALGGGTSVGQLLPAQAGSFLTFPLHAI